MFREDSTSAILDNSDNMYFLGSEAYDGYCMQTGYKSLISGATLPNWTILDPQIKVAWIAAARRVIEEASAL